MLHAHLLPYQREGVRWLCEHPHGVLADDMGLGKTIQAIAACDELKLRRILVICPAVARVNWVREFQKFSLFKREFHILNDILASDKRAGLSLVMSYERACDMHDMGFFKDNDFDVLIIDESHYLKNPFAKRTQSIMGKEGLRACAKGVWALTGTPVTKDIGDLWVFLYTFGAIKLQLRGFLAHYCVLDRRNPFDNAWIPKILRMKPDMMDNLKNKIAKVCLRRTVEEVLPDLPPATFEDVTVERGSVELSPADYAKVQEELEFLEMSVGDITSQAAFGILELLAPNCSTLRRYIGLQKISPAIDLIKEELHAYKHKLVVFGVHVGVCNDVLDRFSGVAVGITGDTPLLARQAAIDKFQTDEKCRLFIGNIHAAGTAITLTAAHHVIFIEQSWIPADNYQAIARCRRIGQTKPVHVRTLTVANSIDEAVSRVLRRRSREIKEILA